MHPWFSNVFQRHASRVFALPTNILYKDLYRASEKLKYEYIVRGVNKDSHILLSNHQSPYFFANMIALWSLNAVPTLEGADKNNAYLRCNDIEKSLHNITKRDDIRTTDTVLCLDNLSDIRGYLHTRFTVMYAGGCFVMPMKDESYVAQHIHQYHPHVLFLRTDHLEHLLVRDRAMRKIITNADVRKSLLVGRNLRLVVCLDMAQENDHLRRECLSKLGIHVDGRSIHNV